MTATDRTAAEIMEGLAIVADAAFLDLALAGIKARYLSEVSAHYREVAEQLREAPDE